MNCPQCGTYLSDLAVLCPQCGTVFDKHYKKYSKKKSFLSGLLNKSGAKTAPFVSAPSNDVQPRKNAPKKVELNLTVPQMIDNNVLLYYYSIAFEPVENFNEDDMTFETPDDFILTYQIENEDVFVFHKNIRLGKIIDNGRIVKMIHDWNKRGDLLKIWLEKYNDNEHCVFVAFYRDEQARLSYREQTVAKLTRYANDEAQSMLCRAQNGYKLDIVEPSAFDDSDNIEVEYNGYTIGVFPKNIKTRYEDEGAAGVFLDHVDYDDDKDKYIPYVKIYW